MQGAAAAVVFVMSDIVTLPPLAAEKSSGTSRQYYKFLLWKCKIGIRRFMIDQHSNEESMCPPLPASHVPLLSHFVTQAAKQGLGDGKK